ncbi:GNAT family N-acetyltransferase [Streptomyces sp. NPDC014894]|uniref:GNAT family N-acetyltransferase n=1 Tax=unclassified Streptomyces TaxID=2593676 RepID=UPI0036FA451E
MDNLVTARLVLHPLSAAEAERVAVGEPGSGDLWADGYPDDGDRTGAIRLLGLWAEHGDPRPFGAYEIRLKEDGRAIGGVGFHGPPDDRGAVTVGYGLVPSEHGKGYASEALRALLELARGLGIACVEGDADLDNIASQRVMNAVGMRRVGEDERLTYYRIDWPVD